MLAFFLSCLVQAQGLVCAQELEDFRYFECVALTRKMVRLGGEVNFSEKDRKEFAQAKTNALVALSEAGRQRELFLYFGTDTIHKQDDALDRAFAELQVMRVYLESAVPGIFDDP